MTRPLSRPAGPARPMRLGLPILAALALAACSDPMQATTEAGAQPPARDAIVVLDPSQVSERKRVRVTREGQLQTPLVLIPEATGAPLPYHETNPNGMQLDQNALVSGGVDTRPRTSIWTRKGGSTHLVYGQPGSGAAHGARPTGIQVTPF